MEDKEEDEAPAPKDRAHKDESGSTELHSLAAQTGADLTTLLNMGFSPAERDGGNKTARDVAEEKGIKENVEAIGTDLTSLSDHCIKKWTSLTIYSFATHAKVSTSSILCFQLTLLVLVRNEVLSYYTTSSDSYIIC